MVSLIISFLLLALLLFPAWVIVKLISLGKAQDALADQLSTQQREFQILRAQIARLRDAAPEEPQPARIVPPAAAVTETTQATTATASVAPPAARVPSLPPLPEAPPPLPARLPVTAIPPAIRPNEDAGITPRRRTGLPSIDWEQFMGAKLFAWLGGLAALLGVAFFIKLSIELDLISPQVRVTLGFVFGAVLVAGGLKINRERYHIAAQTLCATGVVCVYAVTFACYSIYHFEFFSLGVTFGLMALTTSVAFGLAVRLEARVVAILGLLAGFITPVLLPTRDDNALALFGYIALLNAGLIAVALHRGWHFLVGLAAGGTTFIQVWWATRFLEPSRASTAMLVCLGFCALFFGAHAVARRFFLDTRHGGAASAPSASGRVPSAFLGSAIAFPFVAFACAVVFLFQDAVAVRPGFLFSFVFVADVFLLALAWREEDLPQLHVTAGITVFGLLAAWTAERLTPALLPWALGLYLVYALGHAAFPILLQQRRPNARLGTASQIFPPLALLLIFGPLLKLPDVSLALWPCVLFIDLIAVGLALFTASMGAVIVALVLTLFATALSISRSPAVGTPDPAIWLIIAGFTLVFFAAGLFLARKLGGKIGGGGSTIFGSRAAQLPAFSALLPFALLLVAAQRLPLANPTPLFLLALLLAGLALGLAWFFTIEWLPACALAGVAAVAYAWHQLHFTSQQVGGPLTWYLLFYAAFTVYPFLARRRFAGTTGPWAVSALAGVVFFPLVFRALAPAWPHELRGLVPAVFALPPLLGLLAVARAPGVAARPRLNPLAWFGGVALFFVTRIFPIQFDREWLTLAWALEGLALLWLYHHVPHPGLRATGAVLLVIAFLRLAVNPAVLEYHPRADTPLWNWYLYAYGVVIACLFTAARLVAPPRQHVFGIHSPPIFNALGTILSFILLNLEIADFFTPAGARVLTLEFSGHFGRDMTYTIAWAVFALALLLISIWKQTRAGRYAAIALLATVLVKLFFHDLARLEAFYRIGALFAVAVIAFVASVAYQRFLPASSAITTPKR